jgi:hypothetical protein
MTENKRSIKQIAGEVFSQLLNVPVLSGILIAYLYFRLPANEPNALAGFLWAMLFVSIIPLCSLFFYIPVHNEEKKITVHRQRVASFIFMMVSYPIGWGCAGIDPCAAHFHGGGGNLYIRNAGPGDLQPDPTLQGQRSCCGSVRSCCDDDLHLWLIATPLLLLLPLVTWARLAAKGHSFWQTIVGGTLSGLISIGVLWAFGFAPFAGLIGRN